MTGAGPQMGEEEPTSKAFEISPQQAYSDINTAFKDRSLKSIGSVRCRLQRPSAFYNFV
jgi:hypothetical protein